MDAVQEIFVSQIPEYTRWSGYGFGFGKIMFNMGMDSSADINRWTHVQTADITYIADTINNAKPQNEELTQPKMNRRLQTYEWKVLHF